MQTPKFQEQIHRQIYRQIFALYSATCRQMAGVKPFDINWLPSKTRVIDNVSEVIVENQQPTDNTK